MKQQLPLVVLLVAAVVSQGAIARAQQQSKASLSDAATADADRRATTDTRPPVRLLTNADLKPVPRPDPRVTPPPVPAPVTTPPATMTGVPVVVNALQTEAYWKDRSRALHLDLEIAIGRVTGASEHLSGLQEFSYWGGSGLMAAVVADNRFETTATLNQYLAAMQSVQVAIAALAEEARRAGVPPGWLRLP